MNTNTNSIQNLGIIIGILGIILCIWLMYAERQKKERKRFAQLKRDSQKKPQNHNRTFSTSTQGSDRPSLMGA